MIEYRFTLQKYERGSKLTCPKCGRKQCFVKYVDIEGQIAFPDYVGRCDHEHSCQYHYKPSDYFKDNPVVLEDRKSWKSQTKIMQSKPTDYIDRDIMHRSLANYERNPLFIFLSVYLVRKKHPGCSNYTVSGHPRNGEAPRCSGRLTDKEKCEQER